SSTSAPSSSGTGSSDLAHVSSILSCLPSLEGPKTPVSGPLQHANLSSPIVYTPTKLTWYLEHAEKQLGITNAQSYKVALSANGFGPDILDQVENQMLINLGILHGNVIWLKQSAPVWWTGPGVRSLKCKAVNSPPSPPDLKKYQFEKHWDDGSGAASYFGSNIVLEDADVPSHDYSWWFFCPLTQ
ncbi:hypothetical protein L208DRAFT_1298306, partial [Tricholoma matsutake]